MHIGDHNVSIGKKMFTWAYNQLSSSWERALTDTDGMYAELMASSYSANQPDFAWLEPYEEKTFKQSWYPINTIGAPVCATLDAAVSIREDALMIQATRTVKAAVLTVNGQSQTIALKPGKPVTVPFAGEVTSLTLRDEEGRTMMRYCPAEEHPDETPRPIVDNPTLDQLATAQECYMAGVHVAQYRDPAITPDGYWREALRRDPNHAGAHQELARFLYEHLFYEEALEHAMAAWKLLTHYNFHPLSGDVPYLIGLILEALERYEEANDWHHKAAWAHTRSRAMTRIAKLDGRKGDWEAMQEHAQEALLAHPGNGTAAACQAQALRELGKCGEAKKVLKNRLAIDPVDRLCDAMLCAMGEESSIRVLTDDYQVALDLAEDLEQMGAGKLAGQLLADADRPAVTAWPSRHGEYRRLSANGEDQYGLACLLYDRGHHARAAEIWETMPDDYRAVRNLAVAYYSHLGRRDEALPLMEKAVQMAPEEKQLVWETAYLMGRLEAPAQKRIDFLASRCNSTTREDILVEYARLLNQTAQYEKAIEVLLCRQFTPCEGGEHAVAEQYMLAQHAIGRKLYAKGEYEAAMARFKSAQVLPDTLGAGLWNEVLLVPHRFFEAECLTALGRSDEANAIYFDIAALLIDYFSNMQLPELRCWQALCWARLGQAGRGVMMLKEHIRIFEDGKARRDAGYFKTTPFFISFMEPAKMLRDASCDWQIAVGYWAMGENEKAVKHARAALAGEPFTLYARLLIDCIEG